MVFANPNTSVTTGGTIAGSALRSVVVTASSEGSGTFPGTWMNISSGTVTGSGSSGTFVRTA